MTAVVYAESSAVLTWLLGEPAGSAIANILGGARHIVSSDLTLVECDRTIHRAIALRTVSDAAAARIAANFASSAASWTILSLTPQVVARARQRFPREPIRSLDALHVAWALYARDHHPDIALISMDERIRRVGEALGFPLLPD